MYIKYHGHACFEIGNGKRVVFDPHDGKSIGLPVPNPTADLVFITHEHFDHNATSVVRGNFKIIRKPESGEVDGIRYDSITEYHDNDMGRQRGTVNIYKVYVENLSFVHVGDLGHMPDEKTVKFMKNADFIFLPVGSVYTINGDQAAEVVGLTNPRVAVPMHYSTEKSKLGLESYDRFLKHFNKDQVKFVGKEKKFSKEEINSNKTEIWVFE
ncbi:MAG: MBL fold metallo-hydrolase [Thermoplasmata archaeon]